MAGNNPRLVLVAVGLELAVYLGISGKLDRIPLSLAFSLCPGVAEQGASVNHERPWHARGAAHQRQQEHPTERRRHLKMMANQYSEGDAELRVPMSAYWKGCMAKEEFLESDRAPARYIRGSQNGILVAAVQDKRGWV